jgi:hypothetical protein
VVQAKHRFNGATQVELWRRPDPRPTRRLRPPGSCRLLDDAASGGANGRTPEPHSPPRDPQRVALEQRLGVTLPDAIHAWYSRDDALRVLAVHSNVDRPVAIDGRIVFLVEKQGVAFDRAGAIAVRYDKGWQSCGCDPPAFIAAQILDWAEGWGRARTRAWLGSRFQRGSAAR